MSVIDRICYGCVSDLDRPGGVCPRCGWDNGRRRTELGRLPAMTLKDGRFFVGRPLGAGGFGVTYLGRDLMAGEFEDARRAIKEFFPTGLAMRGTNGVSVAPAGAEMAEQFARRRRKAREEGRRMARVSAQVENVVRAYDCFAENGTVYTVMEYIDGDTLTDVVKRDGPMTWQHAFDRLAPVLQALRQMHAQGVYHMDISPDNIMFRRQQDGALGAPVILDFGASIESIESGSGDVTRTVSAAVVRQGYTPPEQYTAAGKGTSDPARVDEYAICATLYFAIAGRAPAGSMDRAMGKVKLKPISSYDRKTPKYFEAALNRGMDLEAKERYASVGALLKALRGGERRPRPMSWGKVGAICASVVAAAVILVVGLRGILQPGVVPVMTEVAVTAVPQTAEPTATVTEMPTPTQKPSPTPTVAPTPTQKPSPTPTPTAAPTPTARITATPTAAPVSASVGEIVQNTDFPALTRDADDVGPSGYNSEDWQNAPVLNHPSVCRKDIASIKFLPSLESAPADAWDVSENRDGRVKAWLTPNGSLYDLTIAGDGGVKVLDPYGSSRLFAGYVSVKTIDFNGCVDLSGRKNLACLFYGCSQLEYIDFAGISTASATDMRFMFYDCAGLTALDLSRFDTSKVTDMYAMFSGCAGLTALDLSRFDTSKVTSMHAMFYDCAGLTALDLSRFDTSKVTDMGWMFHSCTGLTALDLSRFDTSKVTSMNGMFYDCASLTALDLSRFDTSKVTSMGWMFKGCSALKSIGRDPSSLKHGITSGMFDGCTSLKGV